MLNLNFFKRKKAKNEKKVKKIPRSTQQTLPFKTIHENGTCEISKGFYSRTVEFDDMNYQIARQDDKVKIFESYCDFLNYFDTDVEVQVTLVNRHRDIKKLECEIHLEDVGDRLDPYRHEFNEMLSNQILHGKNSISKEKYLTFSVKAENLEIGNQKLYRIENDVINNFKSLGCRARAMSGHDRLHSLYRIFRRGKDTLPFDFEYKQLIKSGLNVKDFVAPNRFNFREDSKRKSFRYDDNYAALSFLRLTSPEMSDEFLSKIMDYEKDMIVTINLHSIKQDLAMKQIKRQLAMMESNKITEQKRAMKQGFDMDLIPSELKKYISEAEEFLEDLQSRNQRLFQANILIMNIGDSMEDIEADKEYIKAIAQQVNCDIQPLTEQQEDGLSSILPIGINKLEIKRNLTTSATAVFIPFTAQELMQTGGKYYGLNGQSRNLIMLNRKLLKNANGLILGSSGSGKSFAAKREMLTTALGTGDDIIIIDPDREYGVLAQEFGGEVIHISANSKTHINPLDMSQDYADGEDPIVLKSEFILSLCESLLGGRQGLSAKEKSIIDRCVDKTYRNYFANPENTELPTLTDFYHTIRQQSDIEAQDIATALEIYVTGSLKVFANKTNVDVNNRIMVYDIKDLGKQLKTMGLLIVLEEVWNRITANKAKGITTWIYIDEFHFLLKNDFTSSYFLNLWKRIRKYGGIPTGITQNVEDVLRSEEGRGILANSEFIQMLSQSPSDRIELAKLLNISNRQLSYITNAEAGCGLIFCSGAIVPFIDKFPKNTELYRLMSTKADEIATVSA